MVNKKSKIAPNRRLDRTRAFQTIYALFFSPVDSVRALARLFNQTIYAPPLPEGSNIIAHSEAEGGEEGAVPPPALSALPDLDPDEILIPQPSEGELPQGFAWELVAGAWSKREELDRLVGRFSQNWRLERMGRVELALLRLAGYELLFRDDVPPRVVINEAIELSRQFGDEASRGFVNGILDAMVKAVESGELSRKSVFWGE